LKALGVAYVSYAARHPGRFHVMFRNTKEGWFGYPAVLEASQLSFVLLTSTADEARRAGNVDVELFEFVLAAWSVVHGLATLWLDGPLQRLTVLTGDKGVDEIAERIVTLSTERIIPK